MHFSHILLALLVIVVWGFNFVVVKIGLDEISPLALVTTRFFLTSLPAIFFVKKPACPFKWVFLYSLVMFALQFSLLFIGMKAGVTAGLASILLQFHVFFSFGMAKLFFGETIHPAQIIGALISFTGIAFIGMNLDASTSPMGFLFVVAAALFWGAGNVISKKMGKINMASLVIWGSLVAWPPLLAVSLFVEGMDEIFERLPQVSWTSVSAVLYITYLSTLFGYGTWNWLLLHYPVGTVAPLTLLVPLVGIGSSILVLEEPLEWWKISAALLVVLGLTINVLGQRIKGTQKAEA